MLLVFFHTESCIYLIIINNYLIIDCFSYHKLNYSKKQCPITDYLLLINYNFSTFMLVCSKAKSSWISEVKHDQFADIKH